MKLLGIPISQFSRNEILAQVGRFLAEPRFHRIATVNPEFLVLADQNPAFKQTLLAADLCVADGFGIVLAGLARGQKITRFPGADMLHEILAIAERDGHAVYLAIKKDGLSPYEEIHAVLVRKYPHIKICGADMDVHTNNEAGVTNHDSQFMRHASIVVCNFGAPEQELFLESIRKNPGDVRLAIGVGGAFDFLTGKQKRAPFILRTLGLEWLWRLIFQPKRWKRIWNAVVVFPVKVVLGSRTSK